MKKIILVLLVVLPVLGFGQDGIKITDNMLLNNKGDRKNTSYKRPPLSYSSGSHKINNTSSYTN